MNDFTDINDLTQQFLGGKISALTETITIGGVEYTLAEEFNVKFSDSVALPHKPKYAMVYESVTASDYTILTWNMNNALQIVPSSVQVHNAPLTELDNRDVVRSYEEKTVGTNMDIILMGLNDNQPITCKVDTGAELCSLDAQNIKVVPNQYEEGELVKFTFNDKVYTVALKQQQAVQSADGGVNYRPVITLSVKYNGQVYPNIDFNLNDRSDMPDPVLLGLNLLKTCDVLIDPKKESVELGMTDEDRNIIQQMVESASSVTPIAEATPVVTDDQIKSLLEAIYNTPGVTLVDIIRHMKSDTLKTIEHLQY